MAVQLHVPEIVRDAGPKVRFRAFRHQYIWLTLLVKGMHARDIAAPTRVDALRLCELALRLVCRAY